MKTSLSLTEAAEFLNVSKQHMYKLTRTRAIRHTKPGGKLIYFQREDLDEFISRNPIESNAELARQAERIQGQSKAGK